MSPEERQQIIDELRLVPIVIDVSKVVYIFKILVVLQHVKLEYQKIANLLDNVSNQEIRLK